MKVVSGFFFPDSDGAAVTSGDYELVVEVHAARLLGVSCNQTMKLNILK
jgi:hypothetical protein